MGWIRMGYGSGTTTGLETVVDIALPTDQGRAAAARLPKKGAAEGRAAVNQGMNRAATELGNTALDIGLINVWRIRLGQCSVNTSSDQICLTRLTIVEAGASCTPMARVGTSVFVSGATLGTWDVAKGAYDYTQDGDVGKLGDRMGSVVVGNLTAAVLGRILGGSIEEQLRASAQQAADELPGSGGTSRHIGTLKISGACRATRERRC